MDKKTAAQASRTNYQWPEDQITHSIINLGSGQRVATALESIASSLAVIASRDGNVFDSLTKLRRADRSMQRRILLLEKRS